MATRVTPTQQIRSRWRYHEMLDLAGVLLSSDFLPTRCGRSGDGQQRDNDDSHGFLALSRLQSFMCFSCRRCSRHDLGLVIEHVPHVGYAFQRPGVVDIQRECEVPPALRVDIPASTLAFNPVLSTVVPVLAKTCKGAAIRMERVDGPARGKIRYQQIPGGVRVTRLVHDGRNIGRQCDGIRCISGGVHRCAQENAKTGESREWNCQNCGAG